MMKLLVILFIAKTLKVKDLEIEKGIELVKPVTRNGKIIWKNGPS